MAKLILIVLILIGCASTGYPKSSKYNKNTIKVAVLDTGFDFKSNWKGNKARLKRPKLCNMGHKDFTGTGMQDTHGHGTHVAGLIGKYAGEKANYCLVIVKVWDDNIIINEVSSITRGIRYATRLGVDIINYSGGGVDFDIYEYLSVKKALDKGILMVVAAGNNGLKKLSVGVADYHVLRVKIKYSYIAGGNLIIYKYTPYFIHRKTSEIVKKVPGGTYYPASYDPRIISVKNIKRNGKLMDSSNRGYAFYHKEVGDRVLSLLPNNAIGYMTGTSQATPTRTGKIIKTWKK